MRRFFKGFWGLSSGTSLALVFSGVILALLESLGMFLIWPVIGVFISSDKGASSFYGRVLEYKLGLPPEYAILFASSVVVFVYIVKNVFLSCANSFQLKKLESWKNELSLSIYKKILSAPYEYHLTTSSSELTSHINVAVPYIVDEFVGNFFKVLSNLVVTAVIFVILISIVGFSSIFFLLTVAAIGIWVNRLIRRRSDSIAQQSIEATSKAISAVTLTVLSIREIWLYNLSKKFKQRFIDGSRNQAAIKQALSKAESWPAYINEIIFMSVLMALMYKIAVVDTLDDPSTRIQILGILVVCFLRLVPTVNAIMTNAQMMMSSIEPLKNMMDLIDNLNSYSHFVFEDVMTGSELEKTSFDKQITLENVTYSYKGVNVFDDLNLTIRRGEWLLITGHSGSGKSTLLNLVTGFLSPSSGHIYVDGQPLTEIRGRLFNQISCLFQDFVILNATLKSNVAFSSPEDIDDARVEDCLSKAGLKHIINRCEPDGTFFKVGENGKRLSGGEKQRLAIARALYADRPIWIFDEPSSALDEQTEIGLLDTIKKLSDTKTIIMTSHRVLPASYADRIISLN